MAVNNKHNSLDILNEIVENIDDIIWKLDIPSQKFTYISPSVEKVRGVSVEEAMASNLQNSLPPDEYNRINEKIREVVVAAKNGEKLSRDFQFETKHYKNNNEIIWLEVKASVILNDQNEAVEVLGVSRDISSKKKKELELEKSFERERFFADIIRYSSQPIGLGYNDGSGVFLNQAAFDLFGYSEEEIENLNWLTDLTPPKWMHKELEILEICARENKPVQYQKEYIHKSGRVFPVEMLVHPKFNDKGDFLFFIAFINDITEIEETRRELQLSNERLEFALKGANDGIWDWDLKTNYQYMSPRYLEMLGFETNEVDYHIDFFISRIHPDDKERVLSHGEYYENNPAIRTEETFRLKHKNEHYIPVLSRAYKIFNNNGELTRIVGTHTDLSEINSLKALLKENELKYKSLFDQSNIGIGITTKDGKLLEANQYLLDLIKITASEISKINIANLYKNKDQREELLNELREKGSINNFQFEFVNCLNEEIWVSLSSKRIENNGEILFINAINNIDLQIKAEQKLKESEERFKQLSKLTNEGILIHKDGMVLDINDSLLKILGLTRKDIIHSKFNQFCISQSKEKIQEILNSSYSIHELQLVNKFGEKIPVEVSGRNANFRGKKARVTSFLDISQRLAIESKVKLLSAAVDQSAHAVAITDSKGYIEFINPMFTKITKYSIDEVIGKSFNLLNTGYHKSSYFKKMWDTINSGEIWHAEFLNKDKDGNLFWAQNTITPVKDQNGAIVNFLSIMEDITSRRKEREEIEKLNNRLKLAVDAARFGFWEYNLSTKEMFWDDIMYEFAQKDKSDKEPIIDYVKSIIQPKVLTNLSKEISFGLAQKNVVEIEIEVLVKGKHKVFKSLILASPKTSENKNSILGITHDITKQKKFEDELIEKRKKAEESDQLKSAFLANMSHEIRTPLNSIIGFTSMLEDEFDEFNTQDIKNYLNIISNNGKHLLSLVNDIIDLSKIESGQLIIINQELIFGDIIRNLEENFKTTTNENVKLKFSHAHDDLKLISDSTRLTQILTNLVSNAIKYTSSGHIKVSSRIDNLYLFIDVEDTGQGISEESRPFIFKRFAQGQPIRDQLLGGTGLGLSITKGLIKLLGGNIWFESEEGKGSTFHFKVLIKNG